MFSLFATALPFSRDASTQWVVLAAALLATIYVIMRPKMRAKKGDPLARPPTAMGVAQQRKLERDIENLMVEMLETARQMTAQLDTRATKLELLIRQADQRLDALKAAGSTSASATPPSPRTTDDANPTAPADDRTASPAPQAPAPAVSAETPPDPRHAEIYAMADSGRSPHEIARSLDRPNGEVELILALRPH